MQEKGKWFSTHLVEGGKVGFDLNHVVKLELQPEKRRDDISLHRALARVQVGDSLYVIPYHEGEKLMNLKEIDA